MSPSALPYITPMMSVPGVLIQAIGTSASYRESADSLLRQAKALDAHLCQAIAAIPKDGGADYFLDLGRLDWNLSRDLFTSIRAHKEDIDARFTLLSHVAGLVDYISHITTNLLPMMSRAPRILASVPAAADTIEYATAGNTSFEWSIALYFGLSPFPVFGVNVDYRGEAVGRALRRFGLGAVAYLSLALRPELGYRYCLPPSVQHDGIDRPIASSQLELLGDGTFQLKA